MPENKILLEFKGDLSYDTIGHFLKILDKLTLDMRMELNSRKILYSILVECLENIFRHYDLADEETIVYDSNYLTQFSLEKQNNEVFILKAANLVSNKNVETLKSKINLINSLDKQGLKNLYKSSIRNLIKTNFTVGSGLGLIDIAKLSGNKIDYMITKLTDEIFYFHIIITISGIIYEENNKIKS